MQATSETWTEERVIWHAASIEVLLSTAPSFKSVFHLRIGALGDVGEKGCAGFGHAGVTGVSGHHAAGPVGTSDNGQHGERVPDRA